MTGLPDVNVLVALLLPEHEHHALALHYEVILLPPTPANATFSGSVKQTLNGAPARGDDGARAVTVRIYRKN